MTAVTSNENRSRGEEKLANSCVPVTIPERSAALDPFLLVLKMAKAIEILLLF